MSQTEKLFKNLSSSSLTNAVEAHIVIGKDRNITVPSPLRRIAVQYDHNVETVTFDCPRFWDGLDMSEMKIYINYLCADRKSGTYLAENIAPDKYFIDVMHFDWTISKNVSMAPGKIAFQVCIKKTDEDGNEQVHWNSEVNKDCFISESLDCDNTEVAELFPDIIEQWHRELMDMCESGDFNGPPGVSPIIKITDINGGHRVTITDINGTQSFDVMDTYVDSSDAVKALLNKHVVVGTEEPIDTPVLWFKGPDASGHYEMVYKDTSGTTTSVYNTDHLADTNNPHNVTPEQIGLPKNIGYTAGSSRSEYTVSIDGITKLVTGMSIVIVPNNNGTSDNMSLNLNNLGAKPFARAVSGSSSMVSTENLHNLIRLGNPVRVTYSGSYWIIDSPKPSFDDMSGVVTIQNGGTDASDAETARQNLGAAAENHTHTDFDNAIETLQSYFNNGGALKMAIQSCNDTDLNTLTAQGIYAGYTGMTNAAVNSISVIEVIPYSNDWVLQRQTVISSEPNDYRIFVRYKYSGTSWSDWARLMTNIVSPEDMGTELPATGVKNQIFYKKVVANG